MLETNREPAVNSDMGQGRDVTNYLAEIPNIQALFTAAAVQT